MRDTVSGSLQRDAVTSKLMRVAGFPEDCVYCAPGETPSQLTLTLSGLVECTNCRLDWDGSYYKPTGVASFLNGIAHVLDHIPQGPPSTNCLWAVTYQGNFGGLVRYSDSACTISTGTYPFIKLNLNVSKTGPNEIFVEVGFNGVLQFPPWAYRAFWNVSEIELSDCIAVSGLTNQLNCITSPIVLRPICSSGTTTIIKGPSLQTWKQERLPSGDGSVQWSPGVNNHSLVDDLPGAPDDDSSYTYTDVPALADYFNFSSFNVPSGGTVTSIQVIFRGKLMQAGGAPHARVFLYVDGITYYGSGEQFLLGDYTTFITTWTNNPDTGNAWTPADVNGIGNDPLQNFGYQYMGFQRIARITQCYIRVNYSA